MPPPPSKIYPQWGCSFCERSYSSSALVTRHQDGYLHEFAQIYHADGDTTTFRAEAHPLAVLRYVRHEAQRHPGATHADIVWRDVVFRPWSTPVCVMVRLDDLEAKKRHKKEFRYLTAEQWVGRLGEIVSVVKPPVKGPVADEDNDDEDDEDDEEDDEEGEEEAEEDQDEEDGEPDEDEEPEEDDEGMGAQQAEPELSDSASEPAEASDSASATAEQSDSPSSDSPSSVSPSSPTSDSDSGIPMQTHTPTPTPRRSTASSTLIRSTHAPASRDVFGRIPGSNIVRDSMAVAGRNSNVTFTPMRRRATDARAWEDTPVRSRRKAEVHPVMESSDVEASPVKSKGKGRALPIVNPSPKDGTPVRRKAKGPARPVIESSDVEATPVRSKAKGKSKRIMESSSADASPVRPAHVSKVPRVADPAAAAAVPDVPATPINQPGPAARQISSAARAAQFYTPGNTIPVFLRLSIVLHVYSPAWIVPTPAPCSLADAVAIVARGLVSKGIGGEGFPALVGMTANGAVITEQAWARLVRKGGVLGVELVWDV